jgi:hypothetical protein
MGELIGGIDEELDGADVTPHSLLAYAVKKNCPGVIFTVQ